MEELRKLEQVQKTLQMLHSNGFIHSSDDDDSNRFLANFILLLLIGTNVELSWIQPCGKLDINGKCQLISDQFIKISTTFLEEALLCLCDKGMDQIENPVSFELKDETVYSEDMAMVRFDSMQRANSTLEDFCRSYFMFHEVDASKAQSIFRYLPMLSFTESYIYQLDSFNEKLLELPSSGGLDFDGGSSWGPSRVWILKFVKLLQTDPFGPLAVLLEHHGLLTERIKEEFKRGEEYWSLERNLCRALMSKKEIPVDDVMRAIHLKSFDFRVLNLLLYQLRGEQVNEAHMEFLSISEFLVEVSDDLFDYEDDVLENNFNILRMFVGIYGASAAPSMLAKSITNAEEKYDCLLKALDPKLSLNYQKRCEEATREGGKICGPPLGTWNIPSVIEDEDLYRSEVLKLAL